MAGLTQDEAETAVVAQNEASSVQRQDDLAQAIPPAQEPLDMERVNGLSDALMSATDRLSGGQVQGDLPRVEGEVDAVPPELFAPLAALAAFVSQIEGAEQFQFDPTEAVTTNNGLAQVAATLDALSQDEAVLTAASSPEPREAPAAEPEPTEDEDDELDQLL